MYAFALSLALLGGLAAAVQSPTNSTLSKGIGNFQATCVSFAGGTLLLAVILLAIGGDGISHITQARPWQLVGGFYGAFIVLSVTIAGPRLGFALYSTVFTLGQISFGMVVDSLGLFGADSVAVSPLRIVGCLFIFAGVIAIYKGTSSGGAEGVTWGRKQVLAAVLALLAGIVGSIQTPTNASLAGVCGKFSAGFVNFSVGLIAAILFLLIFTKGHPGFHVKKDFRLSWWMFLGGPYGVVGVSSNIIATPIIGVTLQLGTFLLGQLVCAAVVDSLGLLRSMKVRLNKWRVAGIIVIACGVVLIMLGMLA